MVNSEKGQALIELIIFLPLMFMFYAMISGFANSINGSINQQKITRGYFYYRVQNNSTIPKPGRGEDEPYKSWSTFGMFFIGWKDYFVDDKPLAPCYKISVPLQASATDKCEERYTTPTTQYIRVQTVYGTCGATYQRNDQDVLPVPDFPGGEFQILTDTVGCLITQ